jgi:hypothetical protein
MAKLQGVGARAALTRPYLKPRVTHEAPLQTPSHPIPNPTPHPIHPSPPHPLRAAMACTFVAAVSSAPTAAARPLVASPASHSVSLPRAAARPPRLAARSARASRLVARAGGVVSSRHLPPLLALVLGRVLFCSAYSLLGSTVLALCRMTCRWSGTRLPTSRRRPCSTRSSSTYVHSSFRFIGFISNLFRIATDGTV